VPSDYGPTIRRTGDPEEAAMAEMRDVHELLAIEEANAWFEYLETTREEEDVRYEELESWAWARLQQRLRATGSRRSRLRPAA
jgi:hypothetical protein